MIYSLSTLFSVLLLFNNVSAFTNGTLLPSYLCGVPGDGYPKSAGTLIPYLQLGTNIDTYNQFPPGNGTIPIQIAATTPGANAAIAPTAAQIIGAFHNGQPATSYTTATTNPVWLAPSNANPNTGAANYTITPGAEHTFVLAVNDPTLGFNAAGVALDGAFLYAMDTATGKRIGAWKNAGATFSAWPACNINNMYNLSVGIVHNGLITGDPNVVGLVWVAPATIVGTVKFIGAGVSDLAYGPVSIEYNTTTNFTALPIHSQHFFANVINDGTQFTQVQPAPDLPFNQVAAAAPTTAMPMPSAAPTTAAPVAGGTTGAAASTYGTTVAVGVGAGVLGVIIGASVAVMLRSRKGSVKEPLMLNS